MKQLRKVYSSKSEMPQNISNRKAAILWSYDNLWNLDRQKQTNQWDTWKHMQGYQSILHSLGAPVDIISVEDDFTDYPFLIVPAFEMVDEALVQKWKDYVSQGGNLIISTRTGAKDVNAHLWESNLSGIMNELIGGTVQTFDMLPAGKRGQVIMNGKTYQWSSWGDQVIANSTSDILARYNDQFYKGDACIITQSIDKGKVWYIGVESLEGLLERDILKRAFAYNDVPVENYPEGVFVMYRDGFMVAVNYSSKVYELAYDGKYLLREKVLKPAGVSVWKSN